MVTWWLLGIHQKWWCKSSAANGYHGWITKGYTWSICVIVKKLSIFPMGMVIFGKMSIPQIPCFHNGTNIYKYVYSCMTPFMATIQLLNYNQTQATVRSNVVKSEIVAVVQKILQLSLRYHHCRAFINLNKYQTFRKKKCWARWGLVKTYTIFAVYEHLNIHLHSFPLYGQIVLLATLGVIQNIRQWLPKPTCPLIYIL